MERGEWVLFDEVRTFFYITNDRELSRVEVINEAMQRCNQENLIAQLKGGVRALHAPLNTLNANWAYMVTTALAWSIKAWLALMLPVTHGRWRDKHTREREALLKMEFRTFVQAIMATGEVRPRAGRSLDAGTMCYIFACLRSRAVGWS